MVVRSKWMLPWNRESGSLVLHGEMALMGVALGGDGLGQVLQGRLSRIILDNLTHAMIAGLVWAMAIAPALRYDAACVGMKLVMMMTMTT